MKISVVGGGVAGLSAALMLQSDGYDVTIYERRNQLGGKMSRIEKGGFMFDVGPTIVMMPHIYNDVLSYTGADPEDYISFEYLDPIYNVTFPDGEKMAVNTNLVDLIDDLEKRGEDVAKGYLKYLNETYEKYLVAKNHFIEKSFRSPRDFYNPKTLRQGLKLRTFDSAHHAISKYVDDEKIQKLLSFQTLYIGISPRKGPSIYTIIPMIETLYGVSYSKGGMYSYVEALEKRFKELGGTVKLNTEVEEVLFANKQTKGVKINGTPVYSDAVIMNADFPYAMNNLIKDKTAKGKYTEKKIHSMDYSCSVLLFYIGLNKKVPSLTVHNLYFGNDFDENLREIFSGKLPSDPAFYIYSPSQVDETVAPEGKENLYVLVPVPELKTSKATWDDATLEDYKEKVFKKLRSIEGLEDIDEQIDVLKIMTPKDFEGDLNAMYGSTFGLAPTLFQSNYWRPKNVHPYVRNLYFAGSSAHPGAGVPIAITSGKLVTQELKKDLE